MIDKSSESHWIAPLWRRKPGARLRLFCLPYGGGGSLAYRTWQAGISDEIDVCPIQLPGREERMSEAPFTEVGPLVEELALELQPYLDGDFAIFGHSAGALVAFQLARELRRTYGKHPRHLFVSALPAPHLPRRRPLISSLPEESFLATLRRDFELGEVLQQSDELLRMISPTLRADFSLVESFIFTPEEPLPFPLTVFGGTRDPEVTQAELEAWERHTARRFRVQLFSGTHFFLAEQETALLTEIAADIRRAGDD